jgi:hypothetical protein
MKPFFLMLITTLFLSSCTTTEIDQFRQTQTSISTEGSIVILGRRQNNDYETEGKFVQCVANVVEQGEGGIKVVEERTFLDAMFPFFEPRTAPTKTGHLRQLMDVDIAKKRISEFGIQYIVWVDGTTKRGDSAGTISCTISPAGGGCFGFGTWEDDANFEAEVWDVNNLEIAGSISTDANGQSYMPALVVPIPLIARVEASACNGLGNQLKLFLNGS